MQGHQPGIDARRVQAIPGSYQSLNKLKALLEDSELLKFTGSYAIEKIDFSQRDVCWIRTEQGKVIVAQFETIRNLHYGQRFGAPISYKVELSALEGELKDLPSSESNIQKIVDFLSNVTLKSPYPITSLEVLSSGKIVLIQ